MKKTYSMDYTKTDAVVFATFKDGKWSALQSINDDCMRINIMNASLHYAVEAFEGLKAYRGIDGKVRIFRPLENAKRFKRSTDYLGMPEVPQEMFVEACIRAVKENIDFLPPYGSMASLYIRPFIICTNPQVNLVCGEEYMFIVAVLPVGSYTGSTLVPTKALIIRDQDRSAPLGSGSYKIGANYAATMLTGVKAKKQGYASILFLDSKERKYIDEFSSSNFFAIRDNTYITPDSPSVLPSITNKSLRQIAADMGMNVEHRAVPVEELATFDECGACGTALVITPVCEINDTEKETVYKIGDHVNAGEKSVKLYKMLTGIQFAEQDDIHNWCMIL